MLCNSELFTYVLKTVLTVQWLKTDAMQGNAILSTPQLVKNVPSTQFLDHLVIVVVLMFGQHSSNSNQIRLS